MRNFIILLGAMNVNFFFAVASILGYEFKGTEESKVYLMYTVSIAVFNILFFVHYYIINKNNIRFKELLVISIPFIFIFIYLLTGLRNGGIFNPLSTNFLSYYLLWGVPAICAGILSNKDSKFSELSKWFELLMLLFTFSIIKSNIIPFLNGVSSTSLGGATYQTASYVAALSYGLNLYFIIYGKNHQRFKFTKNKFYSFFVKILLLVQMIGVFLTGGRGGAVLLIIYNLYIIITVMRSSQNFSKIKFIVFVVILVVSLMLLIPQLLENQLFYNKFNRSFEFFSIDSGINWEGTSNRDIVYINALQLIKTKLFFGYGLFGFWDVTGYPHNIILEILLNGGFFYLLIVMMVLIQFYRKIKLLIISDKSYRLIMIFALYPFTQLIFSGSYMTSSEFWFVLAFVLSKYIIKNPRKTYERKYYHGDSTSSSASHS